MKPTKFVFLVAATIFFFGQLALAEIPQTISYQGVLTDAQGNAVADGSYSLTFNLYESATGGSSIWGETQDLAVVNGLFNAILGSVKPLSNSFDRPYWLGIAIGSDAELEPRIELTASAYSLNARSVADNAVTRDKIAAGQVVKSINELTDTITFKAMGGATITTHNDTITINAGTGGGGTGIQGVQNTNNTLTILDPNGPTATINVKDGGIGSEQLADGAVMGEKIADGQVVRVLQISPIDGLTSSFKDTVHLKAGPNISFDVEGGPNAGIIISAVGGNGASDGWSLTGNAGTDTLVNFLGTTDDQTLELRVNNQRALRIEPAEDPELGFSPNMIGGFSGNNVAAGVVAATISGGGSEGFNSIEGSDFLNRVTAHYGIVGGGAGNTASGILATVGGGFNNSASSDGTTVGGGAGNTASGILATVGGGEKNKARGDFSTVSGGGGRAFTDSNSAIGHYSTVPGGRSNVAQGDYSFAAGRRAKAAHDGAFVWADATDGDFSSTAENQFLIRAAGGVGIGTTNPQADLHIKSTDARIRLHDSFTGQSWDIYTGGEPGDLEFEDVNRGTTPLIIQGGTGNLGIGTTNPRGALHVVDEFSSTDIVESILFIERRTTGTPANGIGGAIEFRTQRQDDFVQTRTGRIMSLIQSGAGTTVDRHSLAFEVRNNDTFVEGMRIRFDGNVGIGITNPAEKLHVIGNALADAHTTPSSRRWKTNIETIENPLEKVQRLRGVTYDWKESGKHDIGLIAEEVGEVIPEIVAYEENGVDAKSVDYARLVAVLIEAVKELSGKVQRLESANAQMLASKK